MISVLVEGHAYIICGYQVKPSFKKVARVASVSNRVIARKVERKQKKVEGGGEKRVLLSPPPHPSFIFVFCSCPSFLDEPREETLATQAIKKVSIYLILLTVTFREPVR